MTNDQGPRTTDCHEDDRIERLTVELEHLRKARHEQVGEIQAVVLGVAEIKLNLATQDKTLAKLERAVNGNGAPGLIVRVDRAERSLASYSRFLWLVAGVVVALLARAIVATLHA
jgi:septal ring factor EnvC (AmiA/AmiB activator)